MSERHRVALMAAVMLLFVLSVSITYYYLYQAGVGG